MFFDKEIPKGDFHYICASIILIYSVLKKDKKLYAQVFLKECKNREK